MLSHANDDNTPAKYNNCSSGYCERGKKKPSAISADAVGLKLKREMAKISYDYEDKLEKLRISHDLKQQEQEKEFKSKIIMLENIIQKEKNFH